VADVLSSLARSQRILALAMEATCPTHDARRGQPCWTLPPASPGSARAQHVGVCGDRAARAGVRTRHGLSSRATATAERLTQPQARVRQDSSWRKTFCASCRHSRHAHAGGARLCRQDGCQCRTFEGKP
jgi:hypothetical protein